MKKVREKVVEVSNHYGLAVNPDKVYLAFQWRATEGRAL